MEMFALKRREAKSVFYKIQFPHQRKTAVTVWCTWLALNQAQTAWLHFIKTPRVIGDWWYFRSMMDVWCISDAWGKVCVLHPLQSSIHSFWSTLTKQPHALSAATSDSPLYTWPLFDLRTRACSGEVEYAVKGAIGRAAPGPAWRNGLPAGCRPSARRASEEKQTALLLTLPEPVVVIGRQPPAASQPS